MQFSDSEQLHHRSIGFALVLIRKAENQHQLQCPPLQEDVWCETLRDYRATLQVCSILPISVVGSCRNSCMLTRIPLGGVSGRFRHTLAVKHGRCSHNRNTTRCSVPRQHHDVECGYLWAMWVFEESAVNVGTNNLCFFFSADTPFEDGTFKLVLQFDETYVSTDM